MQRKLSDIHFKAVQIMNPPPGDRPKPLGFFVDINNGIIPLKVLSQAAGIYLLRLMGVFKSSDDPTEILREMTQAKIPEINVSVSEDESAMGIEYREYLVNPPIPVLIVGVAKVKDPDITSLPMVPWDGKFN